MTRTRSVGTYNGGITTSATVWAASTVYKGGQNTTAYVVYH